MKSERLQQYLPQPWRHARLILALLVASLVVMLPSAYAQVSATINGTVVDGTGAIIPGATVTVTNEATGQNRDTVSNGDGYFAFPALLTGSYSLRIEAKGFKTFEQRGIPLSAGDVRKIPNLVLTIGQTNETVTVEAGSAQIIPVENGQRAAILDYKDIQQLAIQGRNLSELLKVLPGVTSVQNGLSNGAMFDPTVVTVGSSAVGNGLNANGAVNRGGTSQFSDGVDVDDPGCNCSSISIPNPDFTQEVSVQTSNFGADAPRGPVVINTISKSGGDKFHGGGYFYARNDALNANDWQSNHAGTPKGSAHYYYPGGNVGGPIPFTKDKVLFWFGYERILQNTGNSNRLQSFIPTADMMAGNFTNTAANVAFCGGQNLNAKNTNGCNDLTGTILPDGSTVTNGIIPTQFLDPGAKSLASFWPAANADPLTTPGGFNYNQVIPGTHNGYVLRARVDYHLNESNSFFVSYQYGQDKAPSQGNGAHIYWTPGNAIPYPGGGLYSSSFAKSLAGHFTHIFSPTFTNEFIASWGFGNFPVGPSNGSAAFRSTLGYPTNYGTVFNSGSQLIPSYSSAGTLTFPDFSQQDIFETANGSYLVRKEMPSFADDLSKVIKTHTLKFGVFTENVGNIQGGSFSPNGNFSSFNSGGTVHNNVFCGAVVCPTGSTGAPLGSPNNPTANFVMGIATGYSENNKAPVSDMAYQTFSFYGNDTWKATRRLTVEYGIRFEHIGHWYDRQGDGLAVFIPSLVSSDFASGKLNPGVYWHGINPGIPKSGSPDRFLFTSPRFGLSYDLFGTGKTIVRGGWGEYRFTDQYNDYTGALSTAQSILSYGLPGQTSVRISQISPALNPSRAPGTASAPYVGVNGGVTAMDPTDYGIPRSRAYNLTISQQAPLNSLVEIAYVGSSTDQVFMGGESISGSGFTAYTDQNKVPLGGLFLPDPVTGVVSPNPENLSQGASGNTSAHYRPYGFAYGDNTISMSQHVGYSNYNGLQLSWVKRSERLTYNVNYTWSKALGTGQQIDPFTVRGNYGIVAIDRPYVFNASYAYNFLNVYNGESHLLRGVANGWTVSGITTWQSGGNLQATNSPNFGLSITGLSSATYFGTTPSSGVSGVSKLIMPVLTCDAGANLADKQRVNESCFAAPAIGSNGPRNLPYYRNADFVDSDLAAYKTFKITEGQSVQFRASAFNWFNHPLPQFSGGNQLALHYNQDLTVNSSSNSPTLGFLDTKSGGHTQRIMELALKYNF